MPSPDPSRTVAIAGIGRTAYTRKSGRTPLAMATEAARHAVADAGLDVAAIDGIAQFAAGDSANPLSVGHALGLDELAWCLDVFGGGNVVASLIATASAAITSGQCTTAVVYRSLNGRSGKRFGQAGGGDAVSPPKLELGGEYQFAGPQGYMVPPQWLAMWARRHQHVHGSTCEDLGHIAITQRDHASRNPHAVQRTPITMDDYLAGRWINEPLRVYDCALEVDGAVALVLTTLERARDLARRPVTVLGFADSHGGGGSWDQWPDLTHMYSQAAATRLWSRTGLGPADIDVACMYDCFTYTVMATVEDFGFCPAGQAGAFFAEGRATFGGDVVVNPHGGLLSEGYIHGLNHHFEAALQLRGEADDGRQVEGAEVALVTAGAGPFGGAVVYCLDR
jgi:acetyl-CoA acetyltransferase